MNTSGIAVLNPRPSQSPTVVHTADSFFSTASRLHGTRDRFLPRSPRAASGGLHPVRRFGILRSLYDVALLAPSANGVITDDRPFDEYFWLRRSLGRLWRPVS